MGVLDSITSRFSVGGNIVGTLANIFLLLVVAGSIVGIIWFINHRKSYNTLVPTIADRNGSTRFFLDWAAYSKDKRNNLWDFRLQKAKETLMPPPDQCLMVGEGGRNVAMHYQNSAGEIYPCEVEIVKPNQWDEIETEVKQPDGSFKLVTQKIAKAKVKVIEPDIALWGTVRAQKIRETYGHQTWWDKYGNQVMFFGAAVLTLALIFMVLKKIDIVQEAARLFAEASQTLKQSAVPIPTSAP